MWKFGTIRSLGILIEQKKLIHKGKKPITKGWEHKTKWT